MVIVLCPKTTFLGVQGEISLTYGRPVGVNGQWGGAWLLSFISKSLKL